MKTNAQWIADLGNKQLWAAVFGLAGVVAKIIDPSLPAGVLPAFEALLTALIVAFGYQAGQHANATAQIPQVTASTDSTATKP